MTTKTHFPESHDDWRLLRVYVYYRLVLASLLLSLFTLSPSSPLLGFENPKLFLYSSILYLALTCVSLIINQKIKTHSRLQAFIFIIIDILAITLVMHANGGPTPQLSMLYLVMVAAGNILLPGKQGPMIAAVAALAVLYEQFYFILTTSQSFSSVNIGQASLLGLSFFAVALFSQLISHRFRQMEALALQRSIEVENLQRLNEQIIDRMHTGILVVNEERQLLLFNAASRHLLGLGHTFIGIALKDLSSTIDAGLLAWRQNLMMRPLVFKNQPGYPEINVSYMQLGHDQKHARTLIFLENTAQMAQKAQQLKLASLGRLTASIAHEIRNPLGAISHAAQLLEESEDIRGADRRLLTIVSQHCIRVNNIVEKVLQLSRRQKSSPQLLNLKSWLSDFFDEFQSSLQDNELIIECPDELMIRFDTDHLYQILNNMITNGLYYSKKNNNNTVKIIANTDDINSLPYLEVYDFGPGVSIEQQRNLFEPFFTTEKTGTGLGLYLSRELCEANQAHLDYIPQTVGACFRITFSHPNRLI
ncbi:sensor histidine kinase [Agitococcus lubricus]|uniref:histidine kinase n=1 Tax=Agitococcus lubricus TaxID=1077255 RepID=A0A2T5J2N6_9GAMM|nr:ATP-binding protein [Agitococcus lubricus]PTQ90672.1 sensor protein PilS [Agitococcus lubricus]